MKIITQNIRSFNPIINSAKQRKTDKFKKIEILLKEEKPDIAILTETRHYKEETDRTEKVINKPYYILAEHSGAADMNTNRNAGVIIIANQEWQKEENEILYSQERGRYIIVNVENKEKITLIAIYGHSGTDEQSNIIMTQLKRDMSIFENQFEIHPIIMIGDFNVADNFHDTTSLTLKTRTIDTLEQIKEERNLHDLATKTGNDEHTFHTGGQRTYCSSRIDKVLTNLPSMQTYRTKEWITDHRTVIASTQNKEGKNNATIQDHIIKTKKYKDWADNMIKQKIYNNAENKMHLIKPNGDIIEEIDKEANIQENKNFNILMQIVKKMRKQHKTELINKTNKEKEWISRQNKTIAIARRKLKTETDANNIETYKQWINEAAENIKAHYQNKLEKKEIRVKAFYRNKDGKINSTTFREIKEPKQTNRITEILTNGGDRIRNNTEIQQIFENKYKTQTTGNSRRETTIEEYVEDSTMDNIIQDQQIDTKFTQEEIKRAMRNTKTRTAPGFSGDTINLYRLIYAIAPNILVNAINEYFNNQDIQQDEQAVWIKDKKIIYIPKPGRAKNSIKGYRPLSMCETLYKIISKTATSRVNNKLEEVIDIDQSGFVPGRSTQHAIAVALNNITEAEQLKKPLQLVAIDIESAFDSIEPQTVKEAMVKLGYNKEYTEKYHILTTGGEAAIQVNGVTGNKFKPTKGIGQGDPASAPRFIIGHEPFNRKIKEINRIWKYKNQANEQINPTKYADDHLWYLNIQNEENLEELFDLYKEYEKVSGLKINREKTEIICINTEESIRRKLEENCKVVEHFRYLGIYLADNLEDTIKTTLNKTLEKIKIKNSLLRQKKHNLIKKRNLMKLGITSTLNHVLQSIPLSPKQLERLEKERNKAFWAKEDNQTVNKGRTKVSKHRINGPIEIGGLNLTSIECMYRSLSSTAGINILNRAIFGENRHKDTLTNTIKTAMTELNLCTLKEMLQRGSADWADAGKKLTKRAPIIAETMKFISTKLKENEQDNNTWHMSAIKGNSNESIFKITEDTATKLDNNNIRTVGQLFMTNENHTIDTTRPRNMLQLTNERDNIPLKNLITNIQRMTRKFQNKGTNVQKDGTLAWLWIRNCHKFNKEEKKKETERIKQRFPVAPSYKTRNLTDETITKEEYSRGYKNILKAQTSTYNQSLAIEIQNRTIWTNKKANQSNMKDIHNTTINETCDKCGETEDTNHLFLECEKYSEKIWQILQQLIVKAQRRLHIREIAKKNNPNINEEDINYDQNPGTTTTTINFKNILYNTLPKNTNKKQAKQIEAIIYQVRSKIYSTRNNEYQINYNEARIKQHLMNIIKTVREERCYARRPKDLIETMESIIRNEI